jgi:hypothetical protein
MVATIVLIVVLHAGAQVIETWLFSGASFKLRRRIYGHFEQMARAELPRHRGGALMRRAVSDVAAFEAAAGPPVAASTPHCSSHGNAISALAAANTMAAPAASSIGRWMTNRQNNARQDTPRPRRLASAPAPRSRRCFGGRSASPSHAVEARSWWHAGVWPVRLRLRTINARGRPPRY